MYSIDDILELIKQNPEKQYIELNKVICIPFAEVVYCHGYDELIDILDEAICEGWLPKFDSKYEIFNLNGLSLYHSDISFKVSITIDVEEFMNEYGEE